MVDSCSPGLRTKSCGAVSLVASRFEEIGSILILEAHFKVEIFGQGNLYGFQENWLPNAME
jgi:hypothetical protein